MVIQSMKNHPQIPKHGSIALVVSSITSNPQPLPFGAYILIVAGSKSIFVCWALLQAMSSICSLKITLWLCQNSYWKWPFIVDFPIKHGDFP